MTALENMLEMPFQPEPRARPALDASRAANSQLDRALPAGAARETSFLVNGDSYFTALAEAIPQARRSLRIVGWDFHPDILLEPGRSAQTLSDRLHAAVEANPELEVHILVWKLGPIYSGKSLRLLRRKEFPRHPRIRLEFHMHGDLRGSHHQKLVVIDDAVAFIGGIDLTARRWDTWQHGSNDPLRCCPAGVPYDPLHDVQAMVTGDAARLLGDVARHRWLQATGEHHQPVPAPEAHVLDARHQPIADMPISIAMTDSAAGRLDGVALTREVIRLATRHLYIETQYLASFSIAELLEEKLQMADGPEIVIICTRSSHGFIEKMLMANNRDRIIRRLRRADRHDRLRVYYPVVPASGGELEVLVHTKLLIADDQLIRIGSSNLNNRSEGLDTECDVLFSAITPEQAKAVTALRNRLLGEHMGTDGGAVEAALTASGGSLVAAVEMLNTGPRGLRAMTVEAQGSITPVPGTTLLDPKAGLRA